MRLTRVLKHLFLGGVGGDSKTSEDLDPQKPTKGDESRMYHVVAVIVEIAPESDGSTDHEIYISPRRVLSIPKARFIPSTRNVKLKFSVVKAGCRNPAKGEVLPNLLSEDPNILTAGWYQISTSFLPKIVVGQTYNGVVLVHFSPGVKTFTPSPRNAFIVPDTPNETVLKEVGLTS